MVDAIITSFPLCAASAHCWAKFVLLMTICISSPWFFLAFLARSHPVSRIRDICAHSGGSRFVVCRAERRNHTIQPYGHICMVAVTVPLVTKHNFKWPYLMRAVYHTQPHNY